MSGPLMPRRSGTLIDAFTYAAPEPDAGPHVLVLGAIHGNEPCGTIAQRTVMADLDAGRLALARGRVTFIPVCNPEAAAQAKRFVEADLNRIFKPASTALSYEQRLANEIADSIERADIMLDIHSAHTPTTPFVFVDHADQVPLAHLLSLPYAVTGWPDLYAGQTDLGEDTTVDLARARGVEAVLIECGAHDAPDAPKVARTAILDLLTGLGVLAGKARPSGPDRWLHLSTIVRRPDGARLAADWANFQPVTRTMTMAHGPDGTAIPFPADGVCVLPFADAAPGKEWLYVAQQTAAPFGRTDLAAMTPNEAKRALLTRAPLRPAARSRAVS